MVVAEVIPITSSILTESLSYFSATDIRPGTIVTIPLRKQEIRGIVISTSQVKDIKQNLRHQDFKIRNVLQVHNKTIFSPAYLKTVAQLRDYYLINTGKLIDISYPKHITKNFEDFSYILTKERISDYSTSLIQKPYRDRIKRYEEIIKKTLKNSESVHIICPTVLNTKKIYESLVNREINNVYLLHGKTSKKRLRESYKNIMKDHSVIISTASFIDIPAKNKKQIILEHDSSQHYYRAAAPHIDLRLLVEQYAKNSNIHLIFADNVLRPFRFDQVDQKKWDCTMEIFDSKKLSFIHLNTEKPLKQSDAERISDITEKSSFSALSKKIKQEISKSIQNNEKIFCYVHKKSLAPTVVCRDCGNVQFDTESGGVYQLFIKKNRETGEKDRVYTNTKTGISIPAFDLCQFCKSWKLHTLGIGTDTVKNELIELLPEIDVFVVDSLNTKNQTEINKEISSFNSDNSKAKILVGTQLALPYLDTIDSAYIISLDSFFAQRSYTIEHRIISLIKKIYEQTSKKTWIQSRNILSTRVEELVKGSYKNFINESLSESQTHIIHPYGTLIKVNHRCTKADYRKLYKIYTKKFSEYDSNIQVQNHPKKNMVEISLLLHIENQLWNIDNQDAHLYQKIPKQDRNIHIEINPETF